MTKDGFTRSENFLEDIGIDYKGLSEEERAMKKLLLEEYKKKGKGLLIEVRKLRDENPIVTLGEAIRALYKIEEES